MITQGHASSRAAVWPLKGETECWRSSLLSYGPVTRRESGMGGRGLGVRGKPLGLGQAIQSR